MQKTCNICSNQMTPIFSGQILKKYSIQYFHCSSCGYVCTEHPFWLDEAYKKPINITDTGILFRNNYLSKILSCLLYVFFDTNIKGLDYGGGYGILTRLMRDKGFDFYWWDPHTTNIFSQGFEYPEKCDKIDVITAFESFEHFVSPIDDIENILSISQNVFFTTELLPNPLPKPEEWWYYGLEHGQHISFYSTKTLLTIAQKYDLQLYSFDNLFFLTKKVINKKIWDLICSKYGLNLINLRIKRKMKSKIEEDMNYLKMIAQLQP